MVPRWIRALVVLEVAGIVTLVVIGVHLLGDGVQAIGDVVAWARPQMGLGATPPPALQPLLVPPASPAVPRPGPVPRMSGVAGALNGSTADVTFGQIRIITEIQEALRRYLEAEARGVTRGR